MAGRVALAERCRFVTSRLLVAGCGSLVASAAGARLFAAQLVEILTPDVTVALPSGYQDIGSVDRALDWLEARSAESDVLAMTVAATGNVAGLLLLHASKANLGRDGLDVRIGYLLNRDHWGGGLGSELIGGLVDWCREAGDIAALIGIVAESNPASGRVLLKNGFRCAARDAATAMVTYERRFHVPRID